MSVLEKFLSVGRLEALLWSRCVVGGVCSDSSQLMETVIGHLAALPSITSNRLHTKTPDAFLPQQYYPLLATNILCTLEKTCQALRGNTHKHTDTHTHINNTLFMCDSVLGGQDCSLGFVAQVLGKVCIQGHSCKFYSC